jgi:hypothetical protein
MKNIWILCEAYLWNQGLFDEVLPVKAQVHQHGYATCLSLKSRVRLKPCCQAGDNI